MRERHKKAVPSQLQDYPWVPMWTVGLFCTYVVSWYLQVGNRWAILGAIRFEFVLASILVALVGFRWISGAGKGQRNQPLVALAVLLFLIMGVHVVISVDPDHSWFVYNERVIQFAFLGIFVATFVKSPRHLRWMLGALFLAWLKLGQEGLVGNITGGLIWENQGIMRLHGSTRQFAHPNSFAGLALGTLPFVYFLYPIVRSKVLRGFLVLQAILSFHILIYTGSRTSYVGLVALGMFIVWHSPRRVRALVLIALLGFAGLFVVPESYLERATSIITLKEAEGHSSGTRIQILKDAWAIFLENPLGVGVAAFPAARMARFGRFQNTHNLYLEVATNIGVHGLLIFSLLVLTLLRSLQRTRRRATALLQRIRDRVSPGDLDDDVSLIVATALAVESFIVIRLVLGLFGMDLYEIYWWFALGFAVALRNMLHHAERIEAD